MLLTRALVMVVVVSLALVRCGDGPPPSFSEDRQSEQLTDGGGVDAGCGLSFEEALAAYAPERVCQTWVYRVAREDCSMWLPCSAP